MILGNIQGCEKLKIKFIHKLQQNDKNSVKLTWTEAKLIFTL